MYYGLELFYINKFKFIKLKINFFLKFLFFYLTISYLLDLL
jgi:hypothetical protein